MELTTLNQFVSYIEDFFFRRLTDAKKADAIVICNPSHAICKSPVILHSKKSLEDHIRYIQEHQIKKAVVVAEDISFLCQCPSLEYLWIIPAFSANNFDYSPLYKMPNIKWLQCETMYGKDEDRIANVDYSKIQGLQRLAVTGARGHHGMASVRGLKTLYMDLGQPISGTLKGAFDGSVLENLVISQSSICSLEGLEQAKQIKRLELSYNRKLVDISSVSEVRESLVWLDIENCGRIQDFSVLSELHNLELLRLRGSNTLPDLSFLKNMTKLEFFVMTMNVADGDLSMCKRIPYVAIKNRKHFSHKDRDFSKTSSSPSSPKIISEYENY